MLARQVGFGCLAILYASFGHSQLHTVVVIESVVRVATAPHHTISPLYPHFNVASRIETLPSPAYPFE